MNGRVSKAIRRMNDTGKGEKRKYYHYNAAKAAKKQKADSNDPIIAEGRRQVYRASKRLFNYFTRAVGKKRANDCLQWVRDHISEAAKESLAAKGNV